MNAKDTAERIRNLRKARGMSQSQFAAMCGLVQGQLANYEYGRIMPTIPLCERICEAVGIRVTDFLSEDSSGGQERNARHQQRPDDFPKLSDAVGLPKQTDFWHRGSIPDATRWRWRRSK